MSNTLVATGLAVLMLVGCNSGLGPVSNQQKSQQESDVTQGSEKNQADLGSGAAAKYSHPGIMDPDQAKMTAPESFKVKFETTKGDFIVECKRAWSPNGADRFFSLVKIGFFKDIIIFRAISGFMFQFGVHGDPAVSAKWSEANIKDDPPSRQSNLEGFLTFAKTGAPNSRSTQMFINLGNNVGLDRQGFTPFGKVVEGMDVVRKINTEYGENPESFQYDFKMKGNAYAKEKFPNLDMIKSVTLVEGKKK